MTSYGYFEDENRQAINHIRSIRTSEYAHDVKHGREQLTMSGLLARITTPWIINPGYCVRPMAIWP